MEGFQVTNHLHLNSLANGDYRLLFIQFNQAGEYLNSRRKIIMLCPSSKAPQYNSQIDITSQYAERASTRPHALVFAHPPPLIVSLFKIHNQQQ